MLLTWSCQSFLREDAPPCTDREGIPRELLTWSLLGVATGVARATDEAIAHGELDLDVWDDCLTARMSLMD